MGVIYFRTESENGGMVCIYCLPRYRELVSRGCRKCRQVCSGKSTKTRDNVTSDPLEDMYCKTLSSRLCSDVLISIFVFVLVTAIFISTAFCRSTVSGCDYITMKHSTYRPQLLNPKLAQISMVFCCALSY